MRRVILMRHSVRLDDDPSQTWADSATRPHDPPIADHDLPRTAVKRLIENGFRIASVWSSPYRRCLQTAAAAVGELKHIRTIHVHHGLSEAQHEVSRCLRNMSGTTAFVQTGESPLYLTHQGKRDAIDNPEISLVDVDVRHENDDECGGFDKRFVKTLYHIISVDHSIVDEPGDILIVTHGGALNAVGSNLLHPVLVYSIDYCGVMVVDVELHDVLHRDRVELLSGH